MEHLKEKEKFGTPYKEGEDLEPFLAKFLSWIERRIFNRIAKRVNWILDRQKDDTFELTESDKAIDSNGNWRIDISSGDFVIQRKIGGTWTDLFKVKGS